MNNDDKELQELFSSAYHCMEVSPKKTNNGCIEENYDIAGVLSNGFCQWGTSDNRIFVPTTQTKNALIPGAYEIDRSSGIGLFFERIPVKTEGLIRFPDSVSDLVLQEIKTFWERENKFKEFNLVYKRGVLLWGPPGGGKSSLIQLIMQDVIGRGGIVIKFDDPDLFIEGMRAFRKIQPETPVVAIMEDIDAIIEDWSESEVLNILDGVNEVHKTVFLATTNYPEKLGDRIVNRPSRFDKRHKIRLPNEKSREIYIRHLCKEEDPVNLFGVKITKIVSDTENFSLAHLRELFVAVVILGDEYVNAVEVLSSMNEKTIDKIDQEDCGGSLGFNHK